MTTRGTATAGPMIVPMLFFLEGAGEEVEVEADSARTLVLDETTLLAPPPDLVTIDVTRMTDVREEAGRMSLNVAELVAEGEVVVSGKVMEEIELVSVLTV